MKQVFLIHRFTPRAHLRLKKDYDKIWDIVNQRYQYKHRKLPGVILDKKPEILGDDDVLTPRSKRRKNWAEATGGREELNEIEAAHIIVKFMKLTLFKDAGGFLISQQWYGKWVIDRRPNRDQAVIIIQKIVRHQFERWGGLYKFGKRVSHNHELQKRRMKSKNKGQGGMGIADTRPLHPTVPMDIGNVYCSRYFREGEREREKIERIRNKILNADKQIEMGKRTWTMANKKKSGWDTFFSSMMRNANNRNISLLLMGSKAVDGVDRRDDDGEMRGEVIVGTTANRPAGWRAGVKLVGVDKAARAWKSLVKDAQQNFGNIVEGDEGHCGWQHNKDSDPLSLAMANKARTYRALDNDIVSRDEAKKEEEEKEEEEEEEKERKVRKTIKFADEKAVDIGDDKDDEGDEEDSNIYVVEKKRKTRVTFGKFMGLDQLNLNDDDDAELGLNDIGDSYKDKDDHSDGNVLVIEK